MIVNQIAKLSGVKPHVVRYYVRIGLLQPRRDEGNGYQLFDERDLQRLTFVRKAQSLGFTLREIADLLEQAQWDMQGCCARMRCLLVEHIDANRRRLSELAEQQQRMEAEYARWAAADACAAEAGGPCPLTLSGLAPTEA